MAEQRFINRELSWLEFNQRVLDEVTDPHNPLFERLKFASIVCSNMDEFFMIRVASVRDQILAGLEKSDPTGMSPSEIMNRIAVRTHKMTDDLYQKYALSLQSGLRKAKIDILKWEEIHANQKKYLDDYFDRNIFPVLTPMVVDSGRPFPLVLNKSLNIALLVADCETAQPVCFATVQVPSVLGRLVELPSAGPVRQFMLLEELIKMKLRKDLCRVRHPGESLLQDHQKRRPEHQRRGRRRPAGRD
jgi:polyphosphate kinase